jgi:hypothetical protein
LIAATGWLPTEICIQVLSVPICTQELLLMPLLVPVFPFDAEPVAHNVPSFLNPMLNPLPACTSSQFPLEETIVRLLILVNNELPN